MTAERVKNIKDSAATLQAGLRKLHEKGPELKRAISGQLDEMNEYVKIVFILRKYFCCF